MHRCITIAALTLTLAAPTQAQQKQSRPQHPPTPRDTTHAPTPVPEPAPEPEPEPVPMPVPMPVTVPVPDAVPIPLSLPIPTTFPDSLSIPAPFGISFHARSTLNGAWSRTTPCAHECQPNGAFPLLSPRMLFGVRAGGVIRDRVFVDIDYDDRRDFDATNHIGVEYRGREGEFLQRVEVGDVALRLPASRLLTRGIPAGSFGVSALGVAGPLELRALMARQTGAVARRKFRLAGGGRDGLVGETRVVLDDADYVRGQFFWLVPPDSLRGAPHVDPLRVVLEDAPGSVRPVSHGAIAVYVDERASAASARRQAQLGWFPADATVANDAGTLTHRGLFRRLEAGRDYVVHPSGAWFQLRTPLRDDEALAIAYVTASGDSVGTIGAEASGAPSSSGAMSVSTTPARLRLVRAPLALHRPGSATWANELRSVYRIDGGDVDPASVELTVLLGDSSTGRSFTSVDGERITWLRLFGLDAQAPADRLDRDRVYQPAREMAGQTPLTGSWLVLPTREPFRAPPPLPSLSAQQTAAALGDVANAAIYDDVDPVVRATSARFRLDLRYRTTASGAISSFALGAFAIRPGSERIRIGDRLLEEGADYTIDYDLGHVTLNDAASLFALDPDAELQATWERQSLFDVAPVSMLGAGARYDLGGRGAIDLIGLYQAEQSILNRPRLGTEPGSILLAGVTGSFDLGGALFDRALGMLPGMRIDAPSQIRLEAEVALSAPQPNRHGDAFIDDFDDSDVTRIDVRRQAWRLGSRPDHASGDPGIFLTSFDATTATPLVWQHDVRTNDGTVGGVLPRDIDRHIAIAGTQLHESVLRLTWQGSGWRSITTVLASTGRDMAHAEALEFHVRADFDRPLALVFDVGTLSEDAFYVAPDGSTSGRHDDGTPWGLGVLDVEANFAERALWGPDLDARGLWDQPCSARPDVSYPLGDPRANCTRGNGINDGEDLDGNGVLDANDGAHFRYVVRLDEMSPWLVRDTTATGTAYRLYRIPLRDGTPLGGADNDTWRAIRQLRLTLVGAPEDDVAFGGPDAIAAAAVGGGTGIVRGAQLTLARMRFIGARWIRRDGSGIRRGMFDDEPGSPSARVEVGPVSQLTDGAAFSAPPGVTRQLADPSQRFTTGGIEVAQSALRVAYDDLPPGERAEVHHRFAQQPRNLLGYRQLRLWAVARSGEWGRQDGERLQVRVGTDARNYYLYQTTLNAPSIDGTITRDAWLPALAVDFDAWLRLRAEAELRAPRTGFTQDTLWSADSSHALVYQDRARAPNLAAVREIAFAVYNAGSLTTSGEVWLDELRVGIPVTDAGIASSVRLDVAGDFLHGTVGYTSRGAVFRELNEQADQVATGAVDARVTAQLERLLPETWDVALPLTVTHTSDAARPRYLPGTDLRADRLDGLRATGGGRTGVAIGLRRTTPFANPYLGALLDGVSLGARYASAHRGTVALSDRSSDLAVDVHWRRTPQPRDVAFMPDVVRNVLRAVVPDGWHDGVAMQRLDSLRLRWTPTTLAFGTSFGDHDARTIRYEDLLLARAGAGSAEADDAAHAPVAANASADPGLTGGSTPVRSQHRGLTNTLQLGLQPFASLTARLDVDSERDLLAPAWHVTDDPRLAFDDARRSIAGIDVGWETRRVLGSRVAWQPPLARWLMPGIALTTRHTADRHAGHLAQRIDAEGDTTTVLERRLNTERTLSRSLRLRPALLHDALGRLEAIDVTHTSVLASTFDRRADAAGLNYQLGWGGRSTFHTLDGDTAAALHARDELRAAAAVRLHDALRMDVAYRAVESDGIDRFGGARGQSETVWPSVTLRARALPLPRVLNSRVVAWNGSVGYEHVERATRYGVAALRPRSHDEHRVPLELNATFAGGIDARYAGTLAFGTEGDATGDVELWNLSHRAQVTGRFMAPAALRTTLDQPVHASLSYEDRLDDRCRYRLDDLARDCVRYVDHTNRTLNFTLDTMIRTLNLGVQFAWTARASDVGMRAASDRFQLGIHAGFDFSAGTLPFLTAGDPR